MGTLCSKQATPGRPINNIPGAGLASIQNKTTQAMIYLFSQLQNKLKTQNKTKFMILTIDQCLLPHLFLQQPISGVAGPATEEVKTRCLMQDIIQQAKDATGLIWVLIGLQNNQNSANCTLVFYPKDKVDKYEVNELLYGEVMFSNLIVKSVDVPLQNMDDTVKLIQRFIRDIYKTRKLIPITAYQIGSEISFVLAMERPKKEIAGKQFFYLNHYKSASELPAKQVSKAYIQNVITIDSQQGERHFIEVVMGYESKKSKTSNNYVCTTQVWNIPENSLVTHAIFTDNQTTLYLIYDGGLPTQQTPLPSVQAQAKDKANQREEIKEAVPTKEELALKDEKVRAEFEKYKQLIEKRGEKQQKPKSEPAPLPQVEEVVKKDFPQVRQDEISHVEEEVKQEFQEQVEELHEEPAIYQAQRHSLTIEQDPPFQLSTLDQESSQEEEPPQQVQDSSQKEPQQVQESSLEEEPPQQVQESSNEEPKQAQEFQNEQEPQQLMSQIIEEEKLEIKTPLEIVHEPPKIDASMQKYVMSKLREHEYALNLIKSQRTRDLVRVLRQQWNACLFCNLLAKILAEGEFLAAQRLIREFNLKIEADDTLYGALSQKMIRDSMICGQQFKPNGVPTQKFDEEIFEIVCTGNFKKEDEVHSIDLVISIDRIIPGYFSSKRLATEITLDDFMTLNQLVKYRFYHALSLPSGVSDPFVQPPSYLSLLDYSLHLFSSSGPLRTHLKTLFSRLCHSSSPTILLKTASQLIGEEQEHRLRAPEATINSFAAMEVIVQVMEAEVKDKERWNEGKTHTEIEMSQFKAEHYIRYIVNKYEDEGETAKEFTEYLSVLVGIASNHAQQQVDKYQQKFLFA